MVLRTNQASRRNARRSGKASRDFHKQKEKKKNTNGVLLARCSCEIPAKKEKRPSAKLKHGQECVASWYMDGRAAGAARPTGVDGAGPDRLKLSVDAAMNADSTGARFSAAVVPTWPFSCAAWLSCRLQQGTDGSHGPDEAVGAVGATLHVDTWEHGNGMGGAGDVGDMGDEDVTTWPDI